ncbi:hypothetical protein CHUAL_000582 [Chamberlinius hualienensis]
MASSKLSFLGRVAVVTGAGGGLGKQYALLLGRNGASVVVNDIGGSASGEGKNSSAADAVVSEIVAGGGKAVANYDSVEQGSKIVDTALNSFGRVDILINNAGILRDRSFARISDEDWDIIQSVHLRGSFLLSRAAWPHFRKQGYGRIIMTSSAAGVCGNFGQGNYSAAKMGLIGLSNTLAIEGQKYNIHSNVIVPTAASRLTEDLLPPDLFKELCPEYIAPVVVWLCHESCEDNGSVIEAAAGWASKLQWSRNPGVMLRKWKEAPTLENVRDNWSKITDMSETSFVGSIQDGVGLVVNELGKLSEESKVVSSNTSASAAIDPNVAKSFKIPSLTFTYNSKDVILYALGIGISTAEEGHLQYIYENSADFKPAATFGMVPAMAACVNSGIVTGGVPGLNVDVSRLLHGEQYLEVFQPLLPEDKLENHIQVVDVLDKGSGCVIVSDVTSHRGKEPVFRAQFSMFIVGAGNFGGNRVSDKIVPPLDPPSRQPDKVVKFVTGIDQAALYRLSGDPNPLHIDPDFAAMGGFKKPILHGLCTFGIAAKEVIKAYANNDASKFRAMKVRFSKTVTPGQTLGIEMWKEGSRIFVRCQNLDSGEVVLSGSYVDLNVDSAPAPATTSSGGLESDAVFNKFAEVIGGSPNISSQVNSLYVWKILKDGKEANNWTLDLRSGKPGSVYQGEPKDGKAQCTITVADEDLLSIATGKLDAQKAFMSGKMKVAGNVMLLMKLKSLFQNPSKL